MLVGVLLLGGACAHVDDATKGGLVTVPAVDGLPRGTGKRFALIVGIDGARDERWRTLRFATKDASDLASVLRDPRFGAFDDVRLVTDGDGVTRDGLRAEVLALAKRARRPEDVLVIYVSAHGTLDHDAKGELRRYLVTSDADFHRVSQTALGVEEVLTSLGSSASRRRVLVLATCHSGGGKSMLTDAVAAELDATKGTALPALEEVSRASLVFSASDRGEVAREDETLRNDVYTHFLIEALSGAGDRNGDGAVSATEAHDFARRRTWAFSGGRQRPAAEIVEVGADPIFLAGRLRGAGQPELYSYSARLDGFALSVDGAEKGELPGGAAVSPGRHTVELTKGGAVLLKDEISVSEGERVDLNGLVTKREPHRSVSLLGGVVGFLDERSRAELLPGVAAVGAAVRFDHVGFDAFSIAIDVSGFAGSDTVRVGGGAPIPFKWTSVVGGVAGLLRFEAGRVSVWGGPRVAGWFLGRSFSLGSYAGQQSAFSVAPGAQVGVAVRVFDRWEASLNGQVLLSLLTVDGVLQPLGFAGAWLAVGYRF